MLKRYLMVCLIATLCFFTTGMAQSKEILSGFHMEDFYVTVKKSSVKRKSVLSPRPGIKDIRTPQAIIDGTFSGTGSILIHNIKVPVTFSNVTFSKVSPDLTIVAKSGIVSGKRSIFFRWQNSLKYSLDDFEVKIKIPSIKITPAEAKASLAIKFNSSILHSTNNRVITLKSNSCDIEETGAVIAKNFSGNIDFILKDSQYELKMQSSDSQSVCLGSFKTKTLNVFKKKYSLDLNGIVSKENIELFKYNAEVSPIEKKAVYLFELDHRLSVEPTPDYHLTLYSGNVKYRYNSSGLIFCAGDFKANLKIPDNIANIEFSDITLKTDQTGALFNFVTFNDEIKIQEMFLIKPYAAPEKKASWLYFPVWHKNTSDKPGSILCKQAIDFIKEKENAFVNPGLTIFRGHLYFNAPQVTNANPSGKPYNLKTPFNGILTFPSEGTAGILNSSGFSFIPIDENIDDSSIPVKSKKYSLNEINSIPEEPVSRFKLSTFEILDMHIKDLIICENKVSSSLFQYTIHFPFPSFIDLDFEDSTMKKGKFYKAYGPIAPYSYEFEENLSPDAEVMEKIQDLSERELEKQNITKRYNCVDRIFYAWRLPVEFPHKSISIDHRSNEKKALIPMESFDPDNTDILSSEIKVPPLYSKNSGVQFGMRFKGEIDNEGGLEIEDWDRVPVFSKIYPTPNQEKNIGFETSKVDIVLSDIYTQGVYDLNKREYDFFWEGAIQFPFFGSTESKFTIQALVPQKILPVSLGVEKEQAKVCNSSKTVKMETIELKYDHQGLMSFVDTNPLVIEDGNEKEAVRFEMSSYFNAQIILKNNNDHEEIIVSKRVMLIDAIKSDFIIDLVCYDANAIDDRNEYGTIDRCCDGYSIGTLIAGKKLGEADEVISMRASNTKYYPPHPETTDSRPPEIVDLELNASIMKLQTAINPDGEKNQFFIDIPGTHLQVTDSGEIRGSFGATYTPAATQLPYEGVFRFYLDSNNNNFYVQIAGTFTYGLQFRGAIYIFDAPYETMTAPSPFSSDTNILKDLSIRSLFPRVSVFKDTVQLSSIGDDNASTKISGFFTSGNAGWDAGYDFVSLNIVAGPGIYRYKYKNHSNTEMTPTGIFINAIAKAEFFIAEGRAAATLSAQFPRGFPDDFSSEDFAVKGTLSIDACAGFSTWLFSGHCKTGFCGEVRYDSESEFDFSKAIQNYYYNCESGGCPNDFECKED